MGIQDSRRKTGGGSEINWSICFGRKQIDDARLTEEILENVGLGGWLRLWDECKISDGAKKAAAHAFGAF